MNKRIQELERQCWTNREDGLFPGQAHFDADKFALLIVKECVDICESGTSTQTTSSGAAQMIRQHFGIEE